MTENNEQAPKKTLTLGKNLDLKKVGEQVRQSFAHGRSKTVTVEVKRRRVPVVEETLEVVVPEQPVEKPSAPTPAPQRRLTDKELETRREALKKAEAIKKASKIQATEQEEKARLDDVDDSEEETADEQTVLEAEDAAVEPVNNVDDGGLSVNDFPRPVIDATSTGRGPNKPGPRRNADDEADEEEAAAARRALALTPRAGEVRRPLPPTPPVKKEAQHQQPRKLSRHSITRALNDEIEERRRSIASLRRARQKMKQGQPPIEQIRIIREVVISDFITVSELANRMAVRAAEVVKGLMKLGMMVNINQTIDADTAELICAEFGHKTKRVSDADVEIGLKGDEDISENMLPRAPVVTVMGHVDHGKTSLLDALRKTDVASGEAGGITQHIGAYQVQMKSGAKITFIDTPGHAAFTEMRARGANITDIVILVVAADDGIMEQTIEAINHAKAANVPMVVAINKIDKPDANPERVRSELLNHGVVLEEFGGDVLSIEVSAKNGLNLEKLEEAILLQAEVLNLRANPHRAAEATVIEAKVDKGRGIATTILIQRGTLKIGDILVAGKEWGRVRALVNDHGQKIEEATPSMPVEVLGFNGVPSAGNELFVVVDEARAREITNYRLHQERESKVTAKSQSSIEQMMSRIAAGDTHEVAVVIKADVQGSLEAIINSLIKLNTTEVSVRVLHGGVGAINEGDVTLAKASGGVIIGFNVRANPQALDLSRRDNVNIRYYSIIYNVIDDIKVIMGGLLAPTLHEKYLGSAEIREVFSVTKVGKIAGCYIRDGIVRRGSSVRLLRDNVVIHEGTLKTLKRFKEEVREVKESYECGMAFENYNDIKLGDVIECFEIESQARIL
ncbi:MAG: translation initiation factor IF-2 [Alphaproteobacteria bacterium]